MALAGTDVQPGASGQLIANPTGASAVLVVSGLQRLAPGRSYQLWLVSDGTPVSAGVFNVDENGEAVIEVIASAPPASYEAMGVSIEPEGGSDLPTGDVVLRGTIS
jgi:anti-sigma-K factor RskA